MQVRWLKAGYISFTGLFLLLGLMILLFYSRRPIGYYADPFKPFYEGNRADAPGEFDGILRVVTWNMHYGEKIEQAIQTLENAEELQEADVLLLQEIGAEGVELVARRLHYNYVFYPAAFHRQRREEYGNAILSKWPLSEPVKIVLPNWLPGWLQSRNAAVATITVENREIQVYSVHLDTVWMLPVWALTQGESLADEAANAKKSVILAGDFNTWTQSSIKTLENGLAKAGLERLSKGAGYTFTFAGLKLTLDHIFSAEGLDYQSGVYRQTHASDHYPVWADLLIGAAK